MHTLITLIGALGAAYALSILMWWAQEDQRISNLNEYRDYE